MAAAAFEAYGTPERTAARAHTFGVHLSENAKHDIADRHREWDPPRELQWSTASRAICRYREY